MLGSHTIHLHCCSRWAYAHQRAPARACVCDEHRLQRQQDLVTRQMTRRTRFAFFNKNQKNKGKFSATGWVCNKLNLQPASRPASQSTTAAPECCVTHSTPACLITQTCLQLISVYFCCVSLLLGKSNICLCLFFFCSAFQGRTQSNSPAAVLSQ